VIDLVRQLQRHETRCFDRLKPPDSLGRWHLDDLLDEAETRSGRLLAAEWNLEAVGYAAFLPGLTSAEDHDEVLYSYADVGGLAVAVHHRGNGIGRALMSECERLALAAGEKWLRLSVLGGNRSARQFHEGFGMRESLVGLEKKLE
jgi:ribosomal protein S18 acetylase RimI-like enzyme